MACFLGAHANWMVTGNEFRKLAKNWLTLGERAKTGTRALTREKHFRQQADQAAEAAKAAEEYGFGDIASAYRNVEALWRNLAEQEKVVPFKVR